MKSIKHAFGIRYFFPILIQPIEPFRNSLYSEFLPIESAEQPSSTVSTSLKFSNNKFTTFQIFSVISPRDIHRAIQKFV